MTEDRSSKKILLIYPRLGSGDAFIRDIPLSLIHAATHCVMEGIDVEIVDLRLHRLDEWRDVLREKVKGVFLVGVSVMTGTPIRNAIEISRYIKSISAAAIVWGGPHCTVDPDRTIKNMNVDFVIRGFGSKKLMLLVKALMNEDGRYEGIPGLSYKAGERVIHNRDDEEIELLPLGDIPYDLVNIIDPAYSRLGNGEKVFPIFTSIGCPHKCAFCMSPVQYANVKKKWVGYPVEDVLHFISNVIERYKPDYLSVYDDDSFVDMERMRKILLGMKEVGFRIRIGFRGVRIDEIDRMDDDFLQLMEDVGVTHLQIGLESGSQKVLDLIRKRITIEQVLRVNRKLSCYPRLRPIYNLFCGVPGEQIEDLKHTVELALRLFQENPNCLTGSLANYKPIPGSELYDVAVTRGLREPSCLEEWIDYDSAESDFDFPWYSSDYNRHIKLYQVAACFIDRKIEREIKPIGFTNRALRVAARLYRPIAMWRIKHDVARFLPEYHLMKRLLRTVSGNMDE